MIRKVFLVIGADGSIRVSKRPQIKPSEVAIAVNLKFPDTWGRIVATVDLTVPDFTPVVESQPEAQP